MKRMMLALFLILALVAWTGVIAAGTDCTWGDIKSTFWDGLNAKLAPGAVVQLSTQEEDGAVLVLMSSNVEIQALQIRLECEAVNLGRAQRGAAAKEIEIFGSNAFGSEYRIVLLGIYKTMKQGKDSIIARIPFIARGTAALCVDRHWSAAYAPNGRRVPILIE